MSAKATVEKMYSCAAKLVEARVVSVKSGEDRYERFIETFDLRDCPSVKRVFAWEPLGNGERKEKESYTIVEKKPGVHSADDALNLALKELLKSL